MTSFQNRLWNLLVNYKSCETIEGTKGEYIKMKFNAIFDKTEDSFLTDFGDDTIQVTNRMILKNGKPWLPVMGEMHYSRIPYDRWEETLIKMKEGGIEVVASYVLWIHHEEVKGTFDFDGNRNIREFILLCHKLGLEFFLRIGPWAHGECRNGGFPNWLCDECGKDLRAEKEPYLTYVRRYINAVAEQIKGLPLLGIQIENEKRDDAQYIETVHKIVLESGLSAPLYTGTGWGKAKLPKTVLPAFGCYPEAPWTNHTLELAPNPNYFFSAIRGDDTIGADILGAAEGDYEAAYTTPFLTCELGGGNQVTYHRRPLICSRDIEALSVCKLGSGCNLLGYYMYAGGLNPIGLTTMQESKDTGYPNDYPVVSYDFQSPIGDMGQLRESWLRLSYIHRFVHAFGEILAPMTAIMPEEKMTSLEDTETVRCALRSNGESGFLFVNNYTRLRKMPSHSNHPFDINLKDGNISFSIDIPSDCSFFIPVNISLAGLDLLYATAQPVSMEGNRLEFVEIRGVTPAITLRDGRRIVLKAGSNLIDQTEVVLLPYPEYTPSLLNEIGVERVENICNAEILMGHLSLTDRTGEYAVEWSCEDRWLVIKAEGNLAGFYAEGRLISDFYLYGDSWVINLCDLSVQRGIIKIQEFMPKDENTVYLEIPFKTGKYAPRVFTSRDERLFI